MKKNKLQLKDLNIKSFTTSPEKIKGGSIICYQPTQDCPSDPVTLLGEGEFGFCQAYTENNPVCQSNLGC